MACAIVSGYALDCKDAVAGIKNIYITEHANVTAVAENASGFVTGITKTSGTKFFKYALQDPTVGTVAYEQGIVANFVKLQYETQIKLELIIKNRTMIIGETKDGTYFLFGKDFGMEVSAGTGNSGQAMNEFQGYQLTFSGMEKSFANEVDSTIIAALQV
jgi:hypothetical protein